MQDVKSITKQIDQINDQMFENRRIITDVALTGGDRIDYNRAVRLANSKNATLQDKKNELIRKLRSLK